MESIVIQYFKQLVPISDEDLLDGILRLKINIWMAITILKREF